MVLATLRVEKDRSNAGHRDGDREHSLDAQRALENAGDDYSRQTVLDITWGRCGWLVTFCVGLLVSALIVQRFEDLLEHHVQLSFFVPLIMGHGGNTGSQTVSTLIRALALRQIGQRDLLRTLVKETIAGCLMGALLGLLILLVSLVWPDLGLGVGVTVGVALPIISMWANGVGAFLTLMADRFKFDPAVTSVPLMTTIVDATGLIIYFYIAELFLDISDNAAAAHAASSSTTRVATAAATAAAAAGSGAAKEVGKALKKMLMSPPPPLKRAAGGKGR
ncbi:hypothetical protein Agub_g8742 [Astrephomene gubernaculifera]|uniref:SLC41A/MgtE integral membrane domain-containing protein n=1 Tax=Astrephomene gubernaculifera TaxID=47775 RepID=A0AAD3DU02_9CHLO|nr:hypothetical protein Agub_g8742 [Astrephomene gubernaculifera]